jgi:hypothetical protein
VQTVVAAVLTLHPPGIRLPGGTLFRVETERVSAPQPERSMKKFAMLAVVFAFTLTVIGCGPAATTKATTATSPTGTSSTTVSTSAK